MGWGKRKGMLSFHSSIQFSFNQTNKRKQFSFSFHFILFRFVSFRLVKFTRREAVQILPFNRSYFNYINSYFSCQQVYIKYLLRTSRSTTLQIQCILTQSNVIKTHPTSNKARQSKASLV